jgi:hypothetical protein
MNTSGTGLSGSATFTADQAGGSTFTVASNASSANGASTLVSRGSSGEFSAGAITATSFSGSGASLTSIPNGALVNSSTTINGTAIALGSSGTITAASPNTLTISSPLTGTSYNGSSAVSIGIPAATSGTNGFMTSTFASKLDGIAAGATNVTNTNQLTNGAGFLTSAVTSATASTGISVSGSTGAVTFTNTGVTSVAAGTGISVSASTGGITITNSAPAGGIPAVDTVGSYAWCRITQNLAFGSTISGGSILTASVWCNGGFQAGFHTGGSLSGTWRILGTSLASANPTGGTLFIRIS